MNSDGDGVTQDLQQARAWFLRSAELGGSWAMANLARLHRDGRTHYVFLLSSLCS
jgi:TPR repeat protein